MKIKQLAFGDEGLPTQVTVKMSLLEAATITRLFGSQSGVSHGTYGTDAETGTEVYDCLVIGVFNPYWDNGVDEVLTENGKLGALDA